MESNVCISPYEVHGKTILSASTDPSVPLPDDCPKPPPLPPPTPPPTGNPDQEPTVLHGLAHQQHQPFSVVLICVVALMLIRRSSSV